MTNFKRLFLILLFSLSLCLKSTAQDESARPSSFSETNSINGYTNEQVSFTPLDYNIPEITDSTDPNPTDDLPIDANLAELLFAGLLFALYKFQFCNKGNSRSIS